MSHIFDALQRSETERSGIELDAFDLPDELLQMAESAIKQQVAEEQRERQTPDLQIPLPEVQDVALDLGKPPSSSPEFVSLPVCLLRDCKLVSVTDKESLAAEKFRFLAVRLRQIQQRRPVKRLLITSTIPEEGKSITSTNLACTLASRRQRVLLLEGDMRRPVMTGQFGLGRVVGLAEHLQDTMNAVPPIYRLDALGIWVLPAGIAPGDPLGLMQSGRLSLLMDQLNDWFYWIVIDSPPVLPLADTSVWARLVDGILLVTRRGFTDKEQLKRGLENIEHSKLLGAIVNGSTNSAHSDFYERYRPPVRFPQSAHSK